MITLHTFGPYFGLPDPSPFVIKADVLLQMSGLPFTRIVGNLRKAPKGKLPLIDEDGTVVPDSTFIRMHLEQKHGIDFDVGLSGSERGAAWAVEKMCEEQVYWALVRTRWLDDANFDKGPRHFFDKVPGLLRPLVIMGVRRSVRSGLRSHGLGRHSDSEVIALVSRAANAIAAIMGERPYLMGNKPCGADASVFAHVSSLLSDYFNTPLRTCITRHLNLVAYSERMMAQYFPECVRPAVAPTPAKLV
jgi:glutathione S-transferase